MLKLKNTMNELKSAGKNVTVNLDNAEEIQI